jgi:hypothetical protein
MGAALSGCARLGGGGDVEVDPDARSVEGAELDVAGGLDRWGAEDAGVAPTGGAGGLDAERDGGFVTSLGAGASSAGRTLGSEIPGSAASERKTPIAPASVTMNPIVRNVASCRLILDVGGTLPRRVGNMIHPRREAREDRGFGFSAG